MSFLIKFGKDDVRRSGVLGLSSGGFLPVSLLIKLYNCEIFRSSFPYKPDQFYSSLSEFQELPALFRRFFEKNHEDMIMILIRSIPCLRCIQLKFLFPSQCIQIHRNGILQYEFKLKYK